MDQSMEMVVKHPRIPSSVYPVAVWGFNLPAIDLYVFMYIYIYITHNMIAAEHWLNPLIQLAE
jgi:hypothetical protein